jgi:biotin carboxyl carrier protein
VPSDQEILAQLAQGELRELLDLIGSSDVEELELEVSGTQLSLRRAPAQPDRPALAVDEHAAPGPLGAESKNFVVAELVGFFHEPAEPDGGVARPGLRVRAGRVLGTIESLNVPIPVTAPIAGRLVEVLVEDGQPVEYGQPLFLIEPGDD